MEGAPSLEAWQADVVQTVAQIQAGLTAIKTNSGSVAACRGGQKPQLFRDPSSKGHAAWNGIVQVNPCLRQLFHCQLSNRN